MAERPAEGEAVSSAERLAGWRARRRQPGAEMTLTEHLEELRYRVFLSLLAVAGGFVAGWRLVPPFMDHLRAVGGQLIVVTPAEAFVTYLRVAFSIGLVLASPVLMAQVWLFVAPALYPHEAALAVRLAPAAAALFASGLGFGGALMFPVAMRFLVGQSGPGVMPALSAAKVVSFLFGLMLPFGIVFEMPVVAYLLARLGILRPAPLRRMQRWAVFLAFVLAAVLTPTVDPVSQVLMAGPIVLLYEVSIWTAAWGERARRPLPHLVERSE
ncbi:MAG: twin-arginine translocase subunit TatC [Limnochordaceae bacterium]|nr:twin-arginine translocase subunit TatC [Limnochordaceae bacterium]